MASNSTGFERDDHLTPRLISCVGPCPRHSGEEARPAAAPVPPGLMSLLAPCWIASFPTRPRLRHAALRPEPTIPCAVRPPSAWATARFQRRWRFWDPDRALPGAPGPDRRGL